MNSKIKVAVANGDERILRDPIKGRPFSFNMDRVQYVESYSEADYIFGYLDYLECDRDYYRISETDAFRKYSEKFIFWSMHDRPMFAYLENRSKKFICQPLLSPSSNKVYNIIPVPLQMRHYELEMIKDRDFIESCRSNEKVNNFVYVGQIVYANRLWLKQISLPKYDFEETRPIWSIKETKERVELNKKFCKRLSRAKYCFAPKGVGSSSFRLYQAMMVGTVPIVSGMEDYPFKEEVDWSSFCDFSTRGYENLLSDETRYNAMRENAMRFWDEYVYIPNCDRKLFDRYLLK